MTKDQLTREKVYSYIWELPREVTISLCPCGVLPINEVLSQAQVLISVQFSRSVVSESLRPHEPQHTRHPCHHQLPESTQTHVHCVGYAIQPSHPLSSPSSPALNVSQHQER